MNRCLSCDNPCDATVLFCESCRSLLLNRHNQRELSFSASFSSALKDMPFDALPTNWPHLLSVLPEVTDRQSENAEQSQQLLIPMIDYDVDLHCLLLDDWPELQCSSIDDNDEGFDSVQLTDPLKARQLPAKAPLTQSEKRAKLINMPSIAESIPISSASRTQQHISIRRRTMYIVFVAVVVLTLFVGSISIVHNLSSPPLNKPLNSPTINATPTTVHTGEQVLVKLVHFSASTSVYLTHDLQETVHTDVGTSLIRLGEAGSRSIHVFIDSSWGTGEHTIEAEDVTTRFTTTTTIQVISTEPDKPTRLVMSQSTLNMGTGLQGANSIQPLVLHNAGNGTISWVASSNQPWLLFTPTRGVFSHDESILVAVTRANLASGSNYAGLITIYSNVNAPLSIHVTMVVTPLRADLMTALDVTPPALSFMAVDGEYSSSHQVLMIHNASTFPLSWSFTNMTVLAAQQTTPVTKRDWLTVVPRTGLIGPGASIAIQPQLASQRLLPGIYTGILTFTSLDSGYDTVQHVAVSLILQPNTSITAFSTVNLRYAE